MQPLEYAGSIPTIGTEVYVYATTDNSRITEGRTARFGFEFDGVRGSDWVTNPGEGPLFNNLVFSATNLKYEQHTVKMISLSDVTWFLDYIVYKSDNNTNTGPIDGGGGDGGSGGGDGSGSSTGAIVGGTVGGVVFLAVLGLLAFFFLRRRRARQTEDKEFRDYQSVPLASTGHIHSSQGTSAPAPFMTQSSSQPQLQNGHSAGHSKGQLAAPIP